jgi:hypothetical protein
MVCSVAADEDGDAPERRGAYGFDGVAMTAALADQPGVSSLFGVPSAQLPTKMRIEGGPESVTWTSSCRSRERRGSGVCTMRCDAKATRIGGGAVRGRRLGAEDAAVNAVEGVVSRCRAQRGLGY